MTNIKKMKDFIKDRNYFYYIDKDAFLICDPENCSESDRTFDINFFDIANNEGLCNLLHLYYMQGNYGARYTYESRAKWFCGYMSAFSTKDSDEKYNKLLTNPVVRVLITDKKLFFKLANIGLLKHLKNPLDPYNEENWDED